MSIKSIRTEEDYTGAMARLDDIWGAFPSTPEGAELEVLMALIGKYEDEHFPMSPSDPVEAIKFCLEQQGPSAQNDVAS